MNKTSYIFYFMCDYPINNRLFNIKYNSYDEIIEYMWISSLITHIQKPAFIQYNYWLIVF